MSKALKKHIHQDLQRRFERLDGYVLVDFRGLNSAQSYDLRRMLHGVGVRMSVVPNRLALRILDRWQGQRAEFRQFFRGPTAVVYGEDGPLSASKAIAQWKKKNKDLLAIKGGVLSGEIVTAAGMEKLSKIAERPQLLAQLAGTLQAPLAQIACVTQGPLRKLAYALDAVRRKLEESSPAVAAAPEPPAAEMPAQAGAQGEPKEPEAPAGAQGKSNEGPAAAAAPPEAEDRGAQ
jgi:large subunit ribosomal protein L10